MLLSSQFRTLLPLAATLAAVCGSCCGCFFSLEKKQQSMYMGCFQDSKEAHELPMDGGRHADLTVDKCNSICLKQTAKYFGLQAGDSCWCGFSYGGYGMLVDSFCSSACSGNANEKCGGHNINTIYQTYY